MMNKKICLTFLVIFSLTFIHAQNISDSTQAETPISIPLPMLPTEDSKALFEYDKDDSHVEFYAQGSWDAELAEHITFSFINTPSIEFELPVFSQNIDLSLWFLLNNHWYFEAAFADGFEKNTVAAGYYGDNFIKHARISNRGIGLSQNYGLTIGNGSNQAPGISVQMGKDNLESDIMVRYDAYITKSKIFTGKNEVSEQNLSAKVWEEGRFFSLPSKTTAAMISSVYVEDENGTIEHVSGKKLRKLNDAQYMVHPSRSMLILYKQFTGLILVTFSTNNFETFKQTIKTELGSFNGDGFLHRIQNEFTSTTMSTDLSLFSYGGGLNEGYFSSITGIEGEALLIQNPPFFSPFTCGKYYISSVSDTDSLEVIRTSTSTKSQKYTASVSQDTDLYTNLFSSKNLIVEVSPKNTVNSQFPFAQDYPFVYLSSKNEQDPYEIDYSISIKTLHPIETYEIGTNAIPGTIRVLRNGLEDNTFTFDEQKGSLSFISEPDESDTLYITWKEENEELGYISFAAGATYTFSPSLNISLALSAQYPLLLQTTFADSNTYTEGTINTLANVSYINKGLSIDNTVSFTALNKNPTNLYRVDGMDTSSPTSYLQTSSISFLDTLIIPLLNPRKTETTAELSVNNGIANVQLEQTLDPGITGYAFKTSWTIPENQTASLQWTAIELDLESRSEDLRNAQLFSIALKQAETSETNEYDIYLQLGNPEETSDQSLYERRIGTWKISKKENDEDPPDVVSSIITGSEAPTSWQTAQVELNDRDRSLIQNNPKARIIFVQHIPPLENEPISTSILTGPYEIVVPHFIAQSSDAFTLTQFDNSALEIDKINQLNPKGNNTVQEFSWKKTSNETTNRLIQYSKMLNTIPLFSYKKMGFFIKVPLGSDFSEIKISLVDKDESSQKNAISIILNKELFTGHEDEWAFFEIDLDSKKIYLNSQEILVIPDINPSTQANLLEVQITAPQQSQGKIYIDEIYLAETKQEYLGENRFFISYTREGPLVAVKDFPILSDLSADITTNQFYSFSNNYLSIPLTTNAGITITGIKINAGISSLFSQSWSSDPDLLNDKKAAILRIYHSIATSPIILPFKYFSLREDFTFSPSSNTTQKTDALTIKLPFKIPFNLKAHTKSLFEQNIGEQKVLIQSTLSFPSKSISFDVATLAELEQKTKKEDIFTYITSYTETGRLQFSNAAQAYERKEILELKQTLTLPFAFLKPSFTITATQNYESKKETTKASQTLLHTDIPFNIFTQQFVFTHKKQLIDKDDTVSGGSYVADGEAYTQSLMNSGWFFKELVFKDIYSTELFSVMDTINTNNKSLIYTSDYVAGWKRPLTLSSLDFFIPSAAEVGCSRNIISTGNNQGSDAILLKGGFGFTSFNSFGKFSSKPLFLWYEQDELINSWKAEFKFSKKEWALIQYTITGFEKFTLYITDNHTIQQTAELSISDQNNIVTSASLEWKRPGETSPVTALLFLLMPLDSVKVSLSRKSILGYSFEKKEEITHNALLSHELTANVDEYLSIRAKGECNLEFSSQKLENIVVSAVIGAKVSF